MSILNFITDNMEDLSSTGTMEHEELLQVWALQHAEGGNGGNNGMAPSPGNRRAHTDPCLAKDTMIMQEKDAFHSKVLSRFVGLGALLLVGLAFAMSSFVSKRSQEANSQKLGPSQSLTPA